MNIFSAIGILDRNLLPYSIYLLERLMRMCKLSFRRSSGEFQAILFGAEAGGFTTKFTLTGCQHQPQRWVLRQTARGGTPHLSTERADPGPKPPAEHTGRHKGGS